MSLKFEVAVADTAETQKDLTIEIAAEEVQKEFDKTYDSYMRFAAVPGFRPGRVPRGVIKQRFGKDARDAVVGELLPHALQHAVVDRKLRVVGEPKISDLEVKEGAPLKFKASIEVVPEFELKPYKGLKVTKRVRKVTDEDIDHTLERLREGAAQLVPVEDRASESGDFISVNLIGKYVDPQEEHEKEEIKADDLEVELGAEGVQKEFDENLRGTRAGDVREFRVTYPEDFNAKGLAGKTVDFTATVMAVRRKELPELDDDFAQEVSDKQTLDELRAQIREGQQKNAEYHADQQVRDALMKQLTEAHDFAVPETLVDRQAEEISRQFLYAMLNSRVPIEEIRQINWEERRKEDRERAVENVRGALVVGRIAEAENISVSDAEMDEEIARMAAASRQSPDDLKATLTKEGGLASIENRLLYQKALDVVVSQAEVTVEEFTENQEVNQAPGETPSQPDHQPAEQS
ncbi:MAG TPA: trigger factor [Blastocatellia bacterium]|nr:trigger factor [Blastocatellia bacterium]